jgi:hypothetical protein
MASASHWVLVMVLFRMATDMMAVDRILSWYLDGGEGERE